MPDITKSPRRILLVSFWVASAIALAAEIVIAPETIYQGPLWTALALVAAPLNIIANSFIVPPLLILALQHYLLGDGQTTLAVALGVLVGLPFLGLWYFDNGSMPVAFGVMTVLYPLTLGVMTARSRTAESSPHDGCEV